MLDATTPNTNGSHDLRRHATRALMTAASTPSATTLPATVMTRSAVVSHRSRWVASQVDAGWSMTATPSPARTSSSTSANPPASAATTANPTISATAAASSTDKRRLRADIPALRCSRSERLSHCSLSSPLANVSHSNGIRRFCA